MIRRIARDSDDILISRHAIERMVERGITRMEVEACCRVGSVIDDPARDARGDWTCRVKRFGAGRALTIVVRLRWEKSLWIITVMRA